MWSKRMFVYFPRLLSILWHYILYVRLACIRKSVLIVNFIIVAYEIAELFNAFHLAKSQFNIKAWLFRRLGTQWRRIRLRINEGRKLMGYLFVKTRYYDKSTNRMIQ